MGRIWGKFHNVVRRIWRQFHGTNLEDLEEKGGEISPVCMVPGVVSSVLVYALALPFNWPITASASLEHNYYQSTVYW